MIIHDGVSSLFLKDALAFAVYCRDTADSFWDSQTEVGQDGFTCGISSSSDTEPLSIEFRLRHRVPLYLDDFGQRILYAV